MVVGFDVCHDTRNKSNSYAALVASMDKQFSRYFSTVTAHTSGEELSNYMTASVTSEFVCSPYKLLTFITLTFAYWVL
jgi:aubergine-like protein